MRKKINIICGIIAIIAIAGMVFIDTTGSMAMIEELCKVVLLTDFCLWALWVIFQNKKMGTNMKDMFVVIGVVVIFGCITIFNMKDIASDLIQGTQDIELTECIVYQTGRFKGVVNLHYYLEGYDDENNKYRLKISRGDYHELRNRTEVGVTCYINTGRIVNFN